MATANINPTRMELMKLKKRLATTRRGHKLLKDKQDELVHSFMSMVYDTKTLRETTDGEFALILSDFIKMREKATTVELYELVMVPTSHIDLSLQTQNVMSIALPKISVNQVEQSGYQSYSNITSPLETEVVKTKMLSLLPHLIALAEKEQRIHLLTEEISKTRRRVNVIENIMIPELLESIKVISMKLEEDERGNVVRIMKSKDIVLNKINKERQKRKKEQKK